MFRTVLARRCLVNRGVALGVSRVNYSTAGVPAIDIVRDLKVDLKKAMVSKNTVRKTIIRSILTEIKNQEIKNHKVENFKIDEYQFGDILNKLIGQHNLSIEEFQKNNRLELADHESQELSVLEEYRDNMSILADENEILRLLLSYLQVNNNKNLKDVLKNSELITELAAQWNCSPRLLKTVISKQLFH